jgi:lysophospholipase L1-like esterase
MLQFLLILLLSAVAALGFVLYYFSNYYRVALMAGKNSVVLEILGKQGCMLILKNLARLSRSSVAKNRMRVEAKEAIEKAKMNRKNKTDREILFVGSSTFTYWRNISQDMAPLPCINVGFGGSKSGDILDAMEDMVQFQPKVIVYYCGTNDLSAGLPTTAPLENFISFADYMKERIPDIRLVYVSMSITPFQIFLGNRDKMIEANKLIQNYIESIKDGSIVYADVTVQEQFSSNWNWYINDGLHLTDQGHVEFAKAIKPVVARVFSH